ncbi:MAG: hypothetical protein VX777_01645 [Chlamydiota bacterium]|nr:hypothetical protein [Chlamydiota bacterium]
MAGLVGRENMIAQLLTLKLAGIDVTKVEIIGDLSHFSKIVDRDIQALMKQLPEIKGRNQALVIAGCGLEDFVNNLIIKERGANVRASEQFHGDILSVIYTSLKEPQSGVSGIIVLHLNYGEIVERIISRLLQETCCPYIFSGGACGYIRGDKSNAHVQIGSRISVTKSINEEGEIVCLGSDTESVHLQVPSIFLETYQWLEKAKTRGSSVDIETFYILRAIQNHHKNNGYPVECDLGCFVSDFVGEVPLREYSKVYVEYQSVLGKFLGRVFDKQPTMKYHPDKQVDTDIVINSSFNDPKVPHHPMMDPAFVNTKDFESTKIDYRKKIQSLNPSYDKKNLFFNKKWDLDYFLRENNPIVLGKIVDTETYLRKRNDIGMRFLDMPIHMPGQGWRIPVELEQFKEVIEMAVQHEKTVNKNFEKLNYVYITVDQGEVKLGKAQRRVGWHGDSFLPIDTRKEKVDITGDRVYVVGDCCPTPFVPGPFSFEGVNLKSWKEISNHLETIANQFDPSFYEPYTLLRLDPYCIHNVGFNKKSDNKGFKEKSDNVGFNKKSDNEGFKEESGSVFRTFVKISVSEKQYTHLGNAHNPLFIYDWAMTPRKEVPYSNQVLRQSAHREDRDDFKEINPYTIDFNKDISRASWTKEKIFTVKKVSEISAKPVAKGETLPSYDQNFLVSILSSEDGDWKVTTKQNIQYFLSKEKLDKYYDADSERPGVFVSKPETRRVVEIKENIRFMAPWGTMVYAQKGDFLCFASDSDIYPVPQSIYYGDFEPVSE